jgi:hypothetical protein
LLCSEIRVIGIDIEAREFPLVALSGKVRPKRSASLKLFQLPKAMIVAPVMTATDLVLPILDLSRFDAGPDERSAFLQR